MLRATIEHLTQSRATLEAQYNQLYELSGNQADTIERQREELALLGKEDRAIRRLFCARAAHMPYMDDGEASDQEIDFLRDSAGVIEEKLTARGRKQLIALQAELEKKE